MAEAIEHVSGFGELHLRSSADGNNFFALDENDAVANGRVCGTGVNCGTDESRIVAGSERVRRLFQMIVFLEYARLTV